MALAVLAWCPKRREVGLMSQIAYETFGPGGPAAILIQLMLIAVVTWLLSYISTAAGKGNISNMINIVATFICIGIIAGVAWNTIMTVVRIAGLN